MTNKYSYLRNGQKIRVLHEAADNDVIIGVVQIIHEYMWGDNHEESEEDGPIIQAFKRDVFASPPTQVLAEEVVTLKAESDELKKQLRELRQKVRTAEKEAKERIEEYTKFSPVLEKLDEFIHGGITHYFIHERYYAPKILTVEETIDTDSYRRDKKGRLLSLSVKSAKELTWILHQYSDGSGSSSDICTPCTSLEEALALGQQWIDEQAAAENYTRKVISFVGEYGLTLPDGFIQEVVTAEQNAFDKDTQYKTNERRKARLQKEAEWTDFLEKVSQ